MDTLKTIAIAVIGGVIAILGAFIVVPKTVPPLGATPGGDFVNLVNFAGGQVNSTQISTSTAGTATLTANEMRGWLKASIISIVPSVVAGETFTLAASSTIPDVLPRAGDRAYFCVRNATTTANVYLTFAGGTGSNLLVASSSISAVGSTRLTPGKVGCFTVVRENLTSTSYDLDFLLTAFL